MLGCSSKLRVGGEVALSTSVFTSIVVPEVSNGGLLCQILFSTNTQGISVQLLIDGEEYVNVNLEQMDANVGVSQLNPSDAMFVQMQPMKYSFKPTIPIRFNKTCAFKVKANSGANKKVTSSYTEWGLK
jgi:hypothetical protein